MQKKIIFFQHNRNLFILVCNLDHKICVSYFILINKTNKFEFKVLTNRVFHNKINASFDGKSKQIISDENIDVIV